MKVYLMRGLPGAGKTWWIEEFDATHAELTIEVCSADHYFERLGRFDPSKLSQAHNECGLKFKNLLDLVTESRTTASPPDVVFVDNTNLNAWEIAFYVRMCEIMGVEYEIIRVHAPWEVCAARQTHKVPLDKLWAMHQTLLSERLPSHWKERLVLSGV